MARIEQLSLRVTAWSDGSYSLAVVRTDYSGRYPWRSDVIINRWVGRQQLEEAALELVQSLAWRADRELAAEEREDPPPSS